MQKGLFTLTHSAAQAILGEYADFLLILQPIEESGQRVRAG
jgi:hypothetical protein